MHKHRVARLPVTGQFQSALVLAWVLPQVWLDLVRAKSPVQWLKRWPVTPEHAPVSNSHSLLDWPLLNRWSCSPSCCSSCARSNIAESKRPSLRRRPFYLSGGILEPPMSSVPALAFNDVSKHYRGFFRSQWVTALRDFSLRVERGEIFGFLGPNGAGKTTAMHLAIGLMFPSSGRGEMLGHEFGHAPTRRRIGFLA